jgi:signal transduction histidine kinase
MISKTPAALSNKAVPNRQRLILLILLGVLILLWVLVPAQFAQTITSQPVMIVAASPLALLWLTLTLLLSALALLGIGWAVIGKPKRWPLALLMLVLLVLAWAVVPNLIFGAWLRQPAITLRAANGPALLWFGLSLAESALVFLALGGVLRRWWAQASHRRRVVKLASESLTEGIGLFGADANPQWLNGAARRYLYNGQTAPANLHPDAARALARASESRAVVGQHFSPDEGLRINLQVQPEAGGNFSVLLRPVQGEDGQSRFYEGFIRRIVHDMRNPLAAVIAHAGNLQLADADTEAAVTKNTARIIETEALRLTRLVDSLLFDARLAYVPLAIETVNLLDVVEDVMYQHDERAIREEKRIEVEAPPEPALLQADRDLLVRALGNLVDNSLKYSAAGAVVTITLAIEPQHYRLRVSDTGDGIPPDYLPNRIFDPLVRARKDGSGGSGLGLSIVRKIVALHNGQIGAESVLGKGTQITITLPRPAKK